VADIRARAKRPSLQECSVVGVSEAGWMSAGLGAPSTRSSNGGWRGANRTGHNVLYHAQIHGDPVRQ